MLKKKCLARANEGGGTRSGEESGEVQVGLWLSHTTPSHIYTSPEGGAHAPR